MSKNPERLIFNDVRAEIEGERRVGNIGKVFFRDARGWILFGPRDVRGQSKSFMFCLQKLPMQKSPRVRVGCRYYTLAEAWKHWGVRKPRQYTSRRNECRQAVAIIRLMLLQAQAYGLLSLYATPIKFDSSILKRKRHV